MKVKDLIRISKNYWEKAGRMYPAFLSKGQTEITWEDYYKAEQDAKNFDNQEVLLK